MTWTSDNPCYGCGDRKEGCHAKCGRYAAWVEINEARREYAHTERKNLSMWIAELVKNRRRYTR